MQKIECLRDLPAAVISKTQWNSYAKILQFFSAPTIDGEFIPRDPMEMLAKGDFKKVPLLIGSNHDEGKDLLFFVRGEEKKWRKSFVISCTEEQE